MPSAEIVSVQSAVAPEPLPAFAEREYVDVRRCQHIFGISGTAVYRMAATVGFDGCPLVSMIEYRKGARRRILYSSIVRYCDQLRLKYNIVDRRPRLANSFLRHRDEDLLPFPLADTIRSTETLEALGYTAHSALVSLVEEGRFDAYKLVGGKEWRISRSSLAAFITSVQNKPSEAMPPYRRVARPRGLAGKFTSE